MTNLEYILLGLIVLGLLFSFLWRHAARLIRFPCPAWLGWIVEFDNPFAGAYRAHAIIEHLGVQPGMHVLDVGCGPGRVMIPLAQAVGPRGEVVAVDIQSAMLRRAEARARAANVDNICFLQAGVGDGKLEPGRYDRAVLATVLGEIPDRLSALKEIFAALKPGGLLAVSEVIFDPHFQSHRTLNKLASAAGFRESAFLGKWYAFTANFERPVST